MNLGRGGCYPRRSSPGVRDEGLIESALARPVNLASYGEPDAAALAACYAIAKNRGFVDGKKRTAWLLARLFRERIIP